VRTFGVRAGGDTFARERRQGTWRKVRRGACPALALARQAVTAIAHASVAVAAPTYPRTIGGAGHAGIYPSGLDVDGLGNLYVADTGGDQIAAYGPTGIELWRKGVRGPKTLTEFVDPRDVAYLNGVLYVGDTGNRRIGELNAATGLAIDAWSFPFGTILGVSAGRDAAGNDIILVTQDNKNCTQIFTPSGSLLRTVGSGPGTGDGQLKAPRDAATDSLGNVYIADYANNRVAKFSPTGV